MTSTSAEVKPQINTGYQKNLGDLNGAFNRAMADAASQPKVPQTYKEYGGGIPVPHRTHPQNEVDYFCENYDTFNDGCRHESLSKEMAQNSIDAAIFGFKGVKILFELRRSGPNSPYLLITDQETSGLTGRIPSSKDSNKGVVFDPNPEERLVRFLSQGFPKGDDADRALGGRGRGKMLAQGCSKEYEFLFETKYASTHLLGRKWIEDCEFKQWVWPTVKEAKDILHLFDASLHPMQGRGTRIIIPKLIDKVVLAMEDGRMARHIGLTWFDLINREDLYIAIDSGEGRGLEQVKVPADYVFPDTDTDDLVVFKQEDFLTGADKVKHAVTIHLVWSKKPIEKDIRGIALLRGGMLIQRMPGPAEIADNLYGYVRMSPSLEKVMREVEHPTHCHFTMTSGLPMQLRKMVEQACQKFAETRLGFKTPKGDQAYHEAGLRGLAKMGQAFKKLGWKFPGLGKLPPPPPPPGPKVESPVRISVDLKYPNADSQRVDYGQSISWGAAMITNLTNQRLKVNCIIDIAPVRGLVTGLFEKVFVLEPNQVVFWSNTETKHYPVRKADFSPGEHLFKQRVVLMEDATIKGEVREKGAGLYTHSDHVWVAVDEPDRQTIGGLPKLDYVSFVEAEKHLQYKLGVKDHRQVFELNTTHPAYVRLMTIKDEKAKAITVEQYLYSVSADVAIELALSTDSDLLKNKNNGSDDLLYREIQDKKGKLAAVYDELGKSVKPVRTVQV